MAKEYIERDRLIERLRKNLNACNPGTFSELCFRDAIETITNFPAADVVEVVRCRDCKHWHEDECWCDKHSHFILPDGEFCHVWESADWKMFDADYFCADGARRDNNAAD